MQLGRVDGVVNNQPRRESARRALPSLPINSYVIIEVNPTVKSEQDYRTRECAHRANGAPGSYYDGRTYVKQLQRLPSEAALRAAARVTPFFWADAAHINVWLCRDCAVELRLRERESDAA
jgi:hypothetical protein